MKAITFRNFLKQVAKEDNPEADFANDTFGWNLWTKGSNIDSCFDAVWQKLSVHARIAFANCVTRYLELTGAPQPRWYIVYVFGDGSYGSDLERTRDDD